MFNLADFRNPELAQALIKGIQEKAAVVAKRDGADRTIHLMEVCGTHTMAIAKNGLRDVMPKNVKLSSGPGCPVCVTANEDIDLAIEIARQPEVIVTTFGDMLKVPGSYSSMNKEKGEGADVRVVYSPLDALKIAAENPNQHVVFISVGFETTTPIIAATVKRAAAAELENFSIFAANKLVPGVLRALASDDEIKLDGLILPGHVSTIIGEYPYAFLAQEFGLPGAIAGFEPIDVLQGIYDLLVQVADAEAPARIDNSYKRGVMPQGNPAALAMMHEVFETGTAKWRGLGWVEGTGLSIRKEYENFDAQKRLELNPPPSRDIKGCKCGEILRGIMMPFDCRLFGRACRPEHPVGPCMVSSEGSCAAYYRFYDHEQRD